MQIVALLTTNNGCSEKDIRFAKENINFPSLYFYKTIIVENKTCILFKTTLTDVLEICEATTMDGRYFII